MCNQSAAVNSRTVWDCGRPNACDAFALYTFQASQEGEIFMKKKLLSLSVAVVLTLCSVLSPSVTAFANSESESSAAAEAELFYSLPYDDGYTDVLGISQAQLSALKDELFTAAKNFDSQIDIT